VNPSPKTALLTDVLGEPGPDAVRERLYHAFLSGARRRRQTRARRTSVALAAALILVGAVIWRTAGTAEPPRYTLVHTIHAACPVVQTGDVGRVAVVRTTDLRHRVRELTDEQLLAIVAPYGGSLVGGQLVFRDSNQQ
jgi:hypothetical protein